MCIRDSVITDRRAITFLSGFRTTIRSYFSDDLDGLYRSERNDGSGDVIIGHVARRDSDGDAYNTKHGFFGVADAKATEDRLRALASSILRVSDNVG